MNVDLYQQLAARTIAPDLTPEEAEDMAMMGLIGELGELAEPFKKHLFHGKDLSAEAVRLEAGDYLWYIALAATNKATRLSDWAGMPDFADLDAAAQKAIEAAPGAPQPPLFFTLARAVTGQISVAQALMTLAVVLAPFGGLAETARANVRKLEQRKGLEAADLDAIPATTAPEGNE